MRSRTPSPRLPQSHTVPLLARRGAVPAACLVVCLALSGLACPAPHSDEADEADEADKAAEAAAAADPGSATTAELRWVPALRFADPPPQSRGAPPAAAYATISRVSRPALFVAPRIPLQLQCDEPSDASPPSCMPSAGTWKAGARGLVLQWLSEPSNAGAREATRHRLLIPAGHAASAPVSDPMLRTGPAVLRPLGDLPRPDVTTPSFELPPGAELRFAIGVEEAAWAIDSAPVAFRIDIEVDGARHEIYRRVLDPATRAGDRAWKDARVSLDEFAGSARRLHFAAGTAEPGDRRPSLPVWADPTLRVPGAASAPPNVVLMSLDTLRARSMSLYGHERETTPALQRLAAEGAVFTRAFTTFPTTLPSHMSMFTGLYPATHGVIPRGGARRLSAGRWQIAERFRVRGYKTAAFTENGWLLAEAGFRRGFAEYFQNKDTRPGSVGGWRVTETYDRALGWVERHREEPFFLFVHTYEVHTPYDPPASHRAEFGPLADGAGRAEAERLLYEQEIRFLDQEVDRFVARLRTLVPEERLLLVITADHGEEFGEHGEWQHSQLYDEVMHIPLIWIWPGVVRAGARIDALASLVDVAPTALDLVGLPPLRGAEGLSLAPLLREEAAKTSRDTAAGAKAGLAREVLFGEAPPKPPSAEAVGAAECWVDEALDRDCLVQVLRKRREIRKRTPRTLIARSRTHKCMREAETDPVCFDLTADPGETRPLWPGDDPAAAALGRALDGYGAGADRGSAADGGAAPIPLDEETRRKLEALGYLDDE